MTDTAPAATRPDNLLGICAALGEDFGFNPLWLRIALAAGLLWQPMAMVGAYLALGTLVLASRLVFPDRKPLAAAPVPIADNDVAAVQVTRAA